MKKITFSLILFFITIVSSESVVFAADPVGFFDSADCNQMTGWSIDLNYLNSPNQVAIFKDGPAGSGTILGYVNANQPRTSALCQSVGGQNCAVCDSDPSQPQCAHGFIFQTPNSLKDGLTHQIYVHGMHIDNQGVNPLLQLVPKSLTCGLGDQTISKTVNGYPLTIKTRQTLAGAIDSLVWKGKEFVDSVDHGRQIQTAWTVNQYGQCYNPTEAGGAPDGPRTNPSSSKLLDFQITSGGYYTKNYAAFWLAPNIYDSGCTWDDTSNNPSPPWRSGYSVNKTITSNFLLEKNVNIGFAGIENVIEYVSKITVPNNQDQDLPIHYMIMVNPAVYMPVEFNTYYWYDPRSSSLKTTYPPNGYSTTPPILTTPDKQYAMGLYTPEMKWEGYPENEQKNYVGYGGIDWGSTTSIFTRYPVYPPSGQSTFPPGTYTYKSYLIIGTLTDVQTSMQRLYQNFNSDKVDILNLRQLLSAFTNIFAYNQLAKDYGK